MSVDRRRVDPVDQLSKRITVRVDAELYRELTASAVRRDMSVAAVVREKLTERR